MSAQVALRVLRWTYSVFIATSSAATILRSAHTHDEGMHSAALILVLASVEVAGALFLLFEPMELFAAVVLFLVFVVASVVSAASLDWLAVVRFVFYSVTLFYIVLVHRRPSLKQSA